MRVTGLVLVASALVSGVGLMAVGSAVGGGEARKSREPISAPVFYKDTMVIAVSEKGVAAIVFEQPHENGVKYRYRFLAKGAKEEVTGGGRVYELYTDGKYDGGELTIKAGEVGIVWSVGGLDRGWLYYEPEKLRLQVANANRFENTYQDVEKQVIDQHQVDLTRFLSQP